MRVGIWIVDFMKNAINEFGHIMVQVGTDNVLVCKVSGMIIES